MLVKNVSVFSILFLVLFSAFAQKEENDNRFSENLNKPEREEWLRDLGFGMFIHFNTDAQLGITISHSLVGASEDYLQRYFNDLPKIFNPGEFDAFKLAMFARLVGMRYIVFTAKHHSGFCFWDTKTTPFNIMNTPYKRDMLRDYVDAVRKAGLAVGFYYSPEDFKFLHERNVVIKRGDMVFDDKTLRDYKALIRRQTEELFSNYGKIDVFFIDGEPNEPSKEAAWRLQPDVVITRGAVSTPEQTLPGVPMDQLWESCVTLGTQWNYKPTNESIKSGSRLIELLIEARAKGGNFLLNVGPHPDGYLPIEQEAPLREVAAWHFVNHEAVENIRPWIISNEENIWFTATENRKTVYAIIVGVNNWVRGNRKEFVIGSIKATDKTRISVLGQNDKVVEYMNDKDPQSRFVQKTNGLQISVVRAQRIYDDHKWPNPVVIKLENVEPALDPPVVKTLTPKNDGKVITLQGQVNNQTNSNNLNAYFEFRIYPGFAENLYHTEWSSIPIVKIPSTGIFTSKLESLPPGKDYEFRAVVVHPLLKVKGDIVRLKIE